MTFFKNREESSTHICVVNQIVQSKYIPP